MKKINNFLLKHKNVKGIYEFYKQLVMRTLKINLNTFYMKEYKFSLLKSFVIMRCLKQFIKGKPINYILKWKNILNIDFFINKHVLIPRYETEELIYDSIYEIKKYFNNNEKIIFDVCTGSLVIASCLEKNLKNTTVYASDISKNALKVAKKNNKKINKNKVKIIRSNILDYYLKNNLKCNILISNPPYIDEDDSNFIYNSEPINALIAPEKGLFFYNQILKNINKVTLEKSLIIFEIGYNQKEQLEKIIKKYLPNSRYCFKKDINNLWRILYIYKGI